MPKQYTRRAHLSTSKMELIIETFDNAVHVQHDGTTGEIKLFTPENFPALPIYGGETFSIIFGIRIKPADKFGEIWGKKLFVFAVSPSLELLKQKGICAVPQYYPADAFIEHQVTLAFTASSRHPQTLEGGIHVASLYLIPVVKDFFCKSVKIEASAATQTQTNNEESF